MTTGKLGVDLFSIDVLPPKCSIGAEMHITPEGEVWVRFQATAHRRLLRDRRSAWSGWFLYGGDRIVLRWATFWPKEARLS